jgi:hypothetical protein
MPASTKSYFYRETIRPHTWSLGNKDGVLVSIDMDTGETTFGEHYTLDKAARVFWEAVGSRASLEVTAGARARDLKIQWWEGCGGNYTPDEAAKG